jgi:hypothetical protein
MDNVSAIRHQKRKYYIKKDSESPENDHQNPDDADDCRVDVEKLSDASAYSEKFPVSRFLESLCHFFISSKQNHCPQNDAGTEMRARRYF